VFQRKNKFSDYFIKDTNSPPQNKYTPCVAIELCRVLIMSLYMSDMKEEEVLFKNCLWKKKCNGCGDRAKCDTRPDPNNEVKKCLVPQEYKPDTTKLNGTQSLKDNLRVGHCLLLVYTYKDIEKIYTQNTSGKSENLVALINAEKNLFKAADCSKLCNVFDPIVVREDIATNGYNHKKAKIKFFNSQDSIRKNPR